MQQGPPPQTAYGEQNHHRLRTGPDGAFLLIPRIIIHAGTITVDLNARRVLIIGVYGRFVLPSAQKRIGEPLETTAVRGTLQRAGTDCELVPDIRNTPPGMSAANRTGALDSLFRGCEPIGFSQHLTQGGTMNVTFWYTAKGDSTSLNTLTPSDDHYAVWVDEEDVYDVLTLPFHKTVMGDVIGLLRGQAPPAPLASFNSSPTYTMEASQNRPQSDPDMFERASAFQASPQDTSHTSATNSGCFMDGFPYQPLRTIEPPGSFETFGPAGPAEPPGSFGTFGPAGPAGPVGTFGPAGPFGSGGAFGSSGPSGTSGSSSPSGFQGGFMG